MVTGHGVCEATGPWSSQDVPQSLWQPQAALSAHKTHPTALLPSFNEKVKTFPADEGISRQISSQKEDREEQETMDTLQDSATSEASTRRPLWVQVHLLSLREASTSWSLGSSLDGSLTAALWGWRLPPLLPGEPAQSVEINGSC